MTRRLRRVVVATAVAVVVGGQAATASWQDTTSASMPIASGSLTAATGLSATAGCVTAIANVTLGWTATTSPNATGYRIFRRTDLGGYLQIATVAGRTSNSYVDTPVGLLVNHTYYVQAYVGAWTADSGTAAVTTLPVCV